MNTKKIKMIFTKLALLSVVLLCQMGCLFGGQGGTETGNPSIPVNYCTNCDPVTEPNNAPNSPSGEQTDGAFESPSQECDPEMDPECEDASVSEGPNGFFSIQSGEIFSITDDHEEFSAVYVIENQNEFLGWNELTESELVENQIDWENEIVIGYLSAWTKHKSQKISSYSIEEGTLYLNVTAQILPSACVANTIQRRYFHAITFPKDLFPEAFDQIELVTTFKNVSCTK